MITLDTINEIKRLKERRYSQAKVAKQLNISKSTVARYWGEKKDSVAKAGLKRVGFEDVFRIGKCDSCGLTYPKPKFMPAWQCPNCNKPDAWSGCWYPQKPSK